MRLLATVVLVCSVIACSDPGSEPVGTDGPWVGTVTTEGNVTTVVNENGSVWGGKATLVEELSIGVDAGEDPYMFGQVTGLWIGDDAIYVVDSRVPAIRVFDYEGRHLRDIGRSGEGPGEFRTPYFVALDAAGRIFVKEAGETRVVIYSPDGEYLDTWSFSATIRPGSGTLVVTHDGVPYIQHVDAAARLPSGIPDPEHTRRGMQALGPEGMIGELLERPEFPPLPNLTYTNDRGGTSASSVPFIAFGTSVMARSGAWVYGFGSEYKFTIEYPDGARTIVERVYEPVPVLPDERRANETHRTSSIRSRAPGWDWNGPPIPDHKPAFWRFHPAQDDQLIITRLGPGIRSEDNCVEFPRPQDFIDAREERRSIVGCWSDSRIWDVFSQEGEFLGELDIHQARMTALTLRGKTLLAAEEDAAGVIRVKKYRIVPPGEDK